MRGRKPLPTWRHRLEGNPGKRKRNAQEPAPPPVPEDLDTAPPPELTGDARAIEEWTRLLPMLRLGRQVTDADRAALLALCLEWSRYLTAIAKVAATSLIVMTPKGYPIQNPYLPVATKAFSNCAKLWPELGLTPSSRSRVKTTTTDEDPFSEFDRPVPVNIPKVQ